MSIIANLEHLIQEKNQNDEQWQAQRQADRENTNAMQDAGIAVEIAHARFHGKGYNANYSRNDYELDAQSVGYMLCHRFGIPCEAPDLSLLTTLYDGFEPQDRRQALSEMQSMAQKIGSSMEKAITPQVRSRSVTRAR